MDKVEFSRIMAYINTAYNEQPDRAKMSVYYDQLGKYKYEEVSNAVKKWVTISPFYPKISDLINLILGISYEDVVAELRRVIQSDTVKSRLLHPVTRQILDMLGGKMSLGQLSDKDFDYKVKREYKFAIAGIKDDKPKIDSRYGETKQIGEIIGEMEDDSQEI